MATETAVLMASPSEMTLIAIAAAGVSLDLAWTSIPAFERIYGAALRARRIVPPPRHEAPVDGAAGGTVLEAEAGLFPNVLVFDFRSLYPSIMRTFHVDPLAHARAARARSDRDRSQRLRGALKDGALAVGLVIAQLQVAAELPEALQTRWAATMHVLRDPAFQQLVSSYPRARSPFLIAESATDYVTSNPLIRTADGRSVRPEDYLEAFGRYVREQQALTWEDAIRKMTSWPATRMKLAGRGSSAKVTGAYVGNGRQHLDYDTTRTSLAGSSIGFNVLDPNSYDQRKASRDPALAPPPAPKGGCGHHH